MNKIVNRVTMKYENVNHTGKDTTVIFDGKNESTINGMAARFQDFMNALGWDGGLVTEVIVVLDYERKFSSDDNTIGQPDEEN